MLATAINSSVQSITTHLTQQLTFISSATRLYVPDEFLSLFLRTYALPRYILPIRRRFPTPHRIFITLLFLECLSGAVVEEDNQCTLL